MEVRADELSESEAAAATGQSGSLDGRRVAFAGKLGAMNRREAKRVVRAAGGVMSEQVGAEVDLIVIGADQKPSDNYSELLSDGVLEAAGQGTLEIISETEFWQRLGHVEAETDARRLYTPAMLSELLGVPLSTIRRWHRRGLITPFRQVNRLAYFDYEEVASARHLAQLIAAGESPREIETKLGRLAEMFPSLQRPLSQLSIIIEGHSLLLRQGAGLIEPGGQMRIDFAALESGGHTESTANSAVLAFPGRDESPSNEAGHWTTAEEFLEAAIELEDSGDISDAIEVYRSMLLALGPTPDVVFRLAELLYQTGDLPAARERYYLAVELDPEYVEARSSLGCVLVELRQWALAEAAFRGALEHHPDYPDVHFHLARLLDELDRRVEASKYWQEFLQLAPRSPWADEARERLGLGQLVHEPDEIES
jgi:tetratricopeptide (TPR) repeat protein